ncbi:MAG: RNA polymerase sigma-70 factor [Cyclobacteriaceae bacterium]
MAKNTKIRQLNIAKPFEGSFEDVYSEYFKPLYLYARSMSKSDDIAKDVVSDVFFSLWKSKTDLNQIKELKSYLFRSVKNQVIRTLSTDPRRFDSIDTENYVHQIEMINPEEVLLAKELLSLIEKAIQQLPDQCQLIFDMAKNKQMKYAEIALELGVSESTVKSQVSRAVAVLRHSIEEQYNNENSQPVRNYGLSSLILIAILSI